MKYMDEREGRGGRKNFPKIYPNLLGSSSSYIKLQELLGTDNSRSISLYDWLHQISTESVYFEKLS